MTADAALRDRVEAALRGVRDPEAGMDVFEAGLIERIAIDDDDVTIEADLAAFGPRANREVTEAVLAAASAVDGVGSVHVEPVAPSADGRVSTAGIDTIVAVASTKGGVGKTTVATRLACGLAADDDVALFDADIFGPNVPELLGIEGPIHADEDDRPIPVRADGMAVLSVGLMTEGGPLAWRGAMAHDALSDLFADAAWDRPDTLVIDLPPGTSDVLLTTLQEVPIDGVVLVTTPFHTSVADTERCLRLFRENDVPVLGAVVNMTRYRCPSCGDEHPLFPGGDPVADLDVPVLAELPFTPALQGRPRPGEVIEPMAPVVDGVRERLDEIWNPDVPDDALDLRGMPATEREAAVRDAFTALDPGEPFVVLSDRDPSPMEAFLADLADVEDPDEAFEPFRVRKQNPETWILRTVRP